MSTYVITKVIGADVFIPCPNPECDGGGHQGKEREPLPDEVVLRILESEPQVRDRFSTLRKELEQARAAAARRRAYGPLADLLTAREDYQTRRWAAKNWQRARKCPSCNAWIEKNEGCNHMTCKCGHEFLWCCGTKYRTNHNPAKCLALRIAKSPSPYYGPIAPVRVLTKTVVGTAAAATGVTAAIMVAPVAGGAVALMKAKEMRIRRARTARLRPRPSRRSPGPEEFTPYQQALMDDWMRRRERTPMSNRSR
mmetsp:Transcript_14611/g.25717  ORF Transcript_14611/g.25717 Transcript_14611/m.25717 type:complete len:253 (+) Transcript_14611:338-1096(+)